MNLILRHLATSGFPWSDNTVAKLSTDCYWACFSTHFFTIFNASCVVNSGLGKQTCVALYSNKGKSYSESAGDETNPLILKQLNQFSLFFSKFLNKFCPMCIATISRHPPARCLRFYYFCNLMPCPKCTRFYAKAPAGLWIDCLLQLLKSSSHFSTIDYAEWCARTQPFKVALALPNRFLSLINISKIALIFSFMYTFSSLYTVI